MFDKLYDNIIKTKISEDIINCKKINGEDCLEKKTPTLNLNFTKIFFFLF